MPDNDNTDSDTFWSTYLLGSRPTGLPSILGRLNPCAEQVSETLGLDLTPSATTLIAAWGLVLGQHTLEEDILFGLSLQGQHRSKGEKLGKFPFRMTLQQDQTLRDFSEHVETWLQKVLERLDATKNDHAYMAETFTSACLSSSLLRLENDNNGNHIDQEKSGTDLSGSSKSNDPSPPQEVSPLSLTCNRTGGGMQLTAHFDPKSCRPKLVRHLLNQFSQAVVTLEENDLVLLSELNLVNSDERNQIYHWIRPCEPVSNVQLLHQRVEEFSASTPLAIAIAMTDTVMTYKELDDGANALATRLAEMTACTGEDHLGNVAICFEKSTFAVLSMLAILKAGGSFVPLDPEWPDQRVEAILRDANITNVLCSETQESRYQAISPSALAVTPQSIWELKQARNSQQSSRRPIDTSSTAYIIYTSGSTGKPKGIAISHRAISTSITAQIRRLNITSLTRTCQCTAFVFDASVSDIWITLSSGGRLCMPSDDERADIGQFVVREECNYMLATPSMFSTMDSAPLLEDDRTLVLGGEPASRLLLDTLAPSSTSMSNRVVYNAYGPGEASVIAAISKPVIRDRDVKHVSVNSNNVGFPVGVSAFIVSHVNPHVLAPAYGAGELALAGHTLASHYHGDPEKTAQVFRTDLAWTSDEKLVKRVESAQATKRIYLTGDICRFSEDGDGSIVFMYRKGGDYVKVNGYRVDPGEVETRIREVAATITTSEHVSSLAKDNCVLVYQARTGEDNDGDKDHDIKETLACFFTVGDSATTVVNPGNGCKRLETNLETKPAIETIVASLRGTVPTYMIPGLFVPVDKLPVSTSHKLDRRALLATLERTSWEETHSRYGV